MSFILSINTVILHSNIKGVINGKAGKAAALPKFSDTLTLSQPGEADYAHSLALPHRKNFSDYAPEYKHVISVS